MIAPNNSLERTQPQRGFMYDVAMLRRSARGRWEAAVPPNEPSQVGNGNRHAWI